jgi:hypothetical protein
MLWLPVGWLFLNVGAFCLLGSFLYVDALAIDLLLAFYTRRFGYRVSCFFLNSALWLPISFLFRKTKYNY